MHHLPEDFFFHASILNSTSWWNEDSSSVTKLVGKFSVSCLCGVNWRLQMFPSALLFNRDGDDKRRGEQPQDVCNLRSPDTNSCEGLIWLVSLSLFVLLVLRAWKKIQSVGSFLGLLFCFAISTFKF